MVLSFSGVSWYVSSRGSTVDRNHPLGPEPVWSPFPSKSSIVHVWVSLLWLPTRFYPLETNPKLLFCFMDITSIEGGRNSGFTSSLLFVLSSSIKSVLLGLCGLLVEYEKTVLGYYDYHKGWVSSDLILPIWLNTPLGRDSEDLSEHLTDFRSQWY